MERSISCKKQQQRIEGETIKTALNVFLNASTRLTNIYRAPALPAPGISSKQLPDLVKSAFQREGETVNKGRRTGGWEGGADRGYLGCQEPPWPLGHLSRDSEVRTEALRRSGAGPPSNFRPLLSITLCRCQGMICWLPKGTVTFPGH